MPSSSPAPVHAGGQISQGLAPQDLPPQDLAAQGLPATPPPATLPPLPITVAQIPLRKIHHPVTDPDDTHFTARADLPPCQLALPLDWNADPYMDRNWCAQLHMLRMADGHLAAYGATDDPRFLRWPVRLLVDWWRHHIVLRRRSRHGWSDQMVGLRAAKIAFLLGAARTRPGIATRRERLVLAHLARAHALRILYVNPVRLSNHTIDDVIGLRALAEVLGVFWQKRIRAFLARHIGPLLDSQFTTDSIHRENSPGYQGFASLKLRHLLNTGWFDDLGIVPSLAARLEASKAAERWFRMPHNATVPIGDTDGAASGAPLRRAPQETGLFRAAGYVIQRDRSGDPASPADALFLFMGSAQSPVHKHNDDLAWSWYDQGDIVNDTGKYAYKDDDLRDYAISARAHSTVEIDGRDPLPGSFVDLLAHPVGGDLVRHVETTPFGTLISGRVLHSRLHAAHFRTVLYRPHHCVMVADVIEDTADAPPGERRVTQWTHFSPRIELHRRGQTRFSARLPRGRRLDVRLASDRGNCDTELLRGVTAPRRQGWASERYGEFTPRDALALHHLHQGQSRLGSLVTLGQAPLRLTWTRDRHLLADFADQTMVMVPDDGRNGPAVHRRGP